MKSDQRKEIECIKRAFENLPNLKDCVISEKKGDDFSIAIHMSDGYRFILHARTMQNAYPSSVREILSQNKYNGQPVILVAPYISDRTAEICRENGIGYFDYAGNCYFSGHSIYLSETGHKNPEPEKRNSVSVFEPSATVSSRILRELLVDTQKVWRIKHLSEKVGCSLGQVSKVMEFLIKNAWADKSRDGYFLSDPAGLLMEWSRIYGRKKKRSYSFYSLENPAQIEKRLRIMKDDKNVGYYLTGFSGGVRYAPVVRYNRVHFYMKPANIQEAAEYMEMKETPDGANIVIFPLENEVYACNAVTVDADPVVSPVQIYLDCMQLAGRGNELAEAVLNKVILK